MGASSQPVVLFDGYCNFCNDSVNFVIKRDPHAVFKFAPLDSAVGRQLISTYNNSGPLPDSVVLVENGKLYTRTSASLRIAKRLRFPWPILFGLIIIPRPVRNWLYDQFAKRRYQWFGKRETCVIPTPDVQNRFVAEI